MPAPRAYQLILTLLFTIADGESPPPLAFSDSDLQMRQAMMGPLLGGLYFSGSACDGRVVRKSDGGEAFVLLALLWLVFKICLAILAFHFLALLDRQRS